METAPPPSAAAGSRGPAGESATAVGSRPGRTRPHAPPIPKNSGPANSANLLSRSAPRGICRLIAVVSSPADLRTMAAVPAAAGGGSAAGSPAGAAAAAGPGGLRYMSGFDNEHATEALPGALPVGQNSPQVVRRGSRRGVATGRRRVPRPAAPSQGLFSAPPTG